MNKSFFEISIGFFIICLAFGWLFYAKHQIHATRFEGYTLVARFDNADGIQIGSDVKISRIPDLRGYFDFDTNWRDCFSFSPFKL